MKTFIGKALVTVLLLTVLSSLLVRCAVDRVRDKIMSGFDTAANIVSATLEDVLGQLEMNSEGIVLPDDLSELIESAVKPSGSVDVADAGFVHKSYDFAPDSVESLKIDVENCDIALTSGDFDMITVDVLENEEFKYDFRTSDGSLNITDAASGAEEVKLFGLSLGRKEPSVTYAGLVMVVRLPEDFAGEIEISTTDGELKLGNLKLDERLKLKTTNKRISLSNIEAYDIYADTNGARLELTNLSATEIFVSTSSDRITMDELSAKRIKAETTDASIDFSRIFGESLTFKTRNGDISGSLLGSQLLFAIETLTDRTAIPKSNDNPKAYYKLSATTSGGDINIRFVEQ